MGGSKKRVEAVFSGSKNSSPIRGEPLMARLSGVDLRKWYGQREVVRGCFPRSEPRGNRRSARPERGGQNHFVLYADRDHQTVFRGEFSLRIKILARGRSMSAHVWAFLTSRRRVPSSENLRCVKIFRLFWSIRAFPVRSRKKGRMYCLKISVSPDWKKSHAMHLSGGERRRLEIARALIREPKFVLPRRTVLPALTLLRWVISKVWCAPCAIVGSEFSSLTTMSVKH